MRKNTVQTCKNAEQYYLPIINNRIMKKQKASQHSMEKKNYYHITREIKNVERSIKKTVNSLEKLEACLSGQYMAKPKRSKTKFLTQANLQSQIIPEEKQATLNDFYKKIAEQKSFIRKLSNNSSKLENLRSQKLQNGDKKNSALFNNIRNYLDRRLQVKEKQISAEKPSCDKKKQLKKKPKKDEKNKCESTKNRKCFLDRNYINLPRQSTKRSLTDYETLTDDNKFY